MTSTPLKKQRALAERQLMYCRIIGHFFHCVPSNHGVYTLVHDVNKAQGNKQKLLDLVRSAKGPTSAISAHPSCESFDDLGDKNELRKPPLSHNGAKRKALIRDGYRCVITRKYDYNSVKKLPDLQSETNGVVSATQCAHIFSESTNAGTNEGSKADYATSAWAVLSLFGGRECYDIGSHPTYGFRHPVA